jgi:hypothetical protein
MSVAIAWIITILVLVILVQFVFYVISLHRLPTEERPRTATYDRYGSYIGMRKNPDYHENPGEHESENRAS